MLWRRFVRRKRSTLKRHVEKENVGERRGKKVKPEESCRSSQSSFGIRQKPKSVIIRLNSYATRSKNNVKVTRCQRELKLFESGEIENQ